MHLSSSLGVSSSTSLSFSFLKESPALSARLSTPLALSNKWWDSGVAPFYTVQ